MTHLMRSNTKLMLDFERFLTFTSDTHREVYKKIHSSHGPLMRSNVGVFFQLLPLLLCDAHMEVSMKNLHSSHYPLMRTNVCIFFFPSFLLKLIGRFFLKKIHISHDLFMISNVGLFFHSCHLMVIGRSL